MIKAVLFDLDDTLTDRTASLSKYAALFHREFARLLGTVTVREIESTFVVLDAGGYRPRDEVYAGIVERLAWAHTPEISAIRDHWGTWFPQSTVARGELQETLAALAAASLRLGVVTNGSVLIQSAKIAQLGIGHYLATVVISEATHCKKPDPRIFQHALEEIGCLAGETSFVGDHPLNDIVGSVEAGLVPVWLEGIHAWPCDHLQVRVTPAKLDRHSVSFLAYIPPSIRCFRQNAFQPLRGRQGLLTPGCIVFGVPLTSALTHIHKRNFSVRFIGNLLPMITFAAFHSLLTPSRGSG